MSANRPLFSLVQGSDFGTRSRARLWAARWINPVDAAVKRKVAEIKAKAANERVAQDSKQSNL